MIARDPFRKALHGQRPIVQVRKNHIRNLRIKRNDFALRETALAVKDLVEIRERKLSATGFNDLLLFWHAPPRIRQSCSEFSHQLHSASRHLWLTASWSRLTNGRRPRQREADSARAFPRARPQSNPRDKVSRVSLARRESASISRKTLSRNFVGSPPPQSG